MRALYIVVGAALGWLTIGVALGFLFQAVVYYAVDVPDDVHRVVGGIGALGGALVGALLGKWRYDDKRGDTERGQAPVSRQTAPEPWSAEQEAHPALSLRRRLDELQELLASGYISQGEHDRLREEALRRFSAAP